MSTRRLAATVSINRLIDQADHQVRFGSLADAGTFSADVRFAPNRGHPTATLAV